MFPSLPPPPPKKNKKKKKEKEKNNNNKKVKRVQTTEIVQIFVNKGGRWD